VAAQVTVPTLVLVGGASPEWMIEVGKSVAGTVQNGEHRVLEGQEHAVSPHVLRPVLVDFLAGR
jgi:hypothetical protein